MLDSFNNYFNGKYGKYVKYWKCELIGQGLESKNKKKKTQLELIVRSLKSRVLYHNLKFLQKNLFRALSSTETINNNSKLVI